ncbi:MAG: alpha/beta fold hydrolase [Oxalobacter formigenes]|nr:alpha/beta fold hydrolase [Oxalobacter formigenes]
MILYLHGFHSSPLSFKAQAAEAYMKEHGLAGRFFCPQLPESPMQSVMLAAQFMEGYEPGRVLLIGSSLGGYYANWLAERFGCKAVLLNPVVDPWDIKAEKNLPPDAPAMAEWALGREMYGQELHQLRVMKVTRPERYFLIAATGDELLDYRQMCAHYEGVRQVVVDGDDHSLKAFPAYLDEIIDFWQPA